MKYFDLTLPMPVSINAAHALTGGKFNYKTKKYERSKVRSAEYTEWTEYAAIAWRKEYPCRVKNLFIGRVRIDLIFVWIAGDRGTASSDIDNRIKVLQDFLQGKFFVNDSQIDEIHAFRRHAADGDPHVKIRVTEISDRRPLEIQKDTR